ncbi:MAG: NADH:flavin oxidoreductase, partial [Deltaproteobacteria bacterium]|nr:NADH:flavin oxidoreductase [Deltaproteobacteria bacterium]
MSTINLPKNCRQAFIPTIIGGLPLKNRFLRAATWDGLAGPDGEVTAAQLALYTELARGGSALLTSGYTSVSPGGRQLAGQNSLHRDDNLASFARLAAAVHRHDARLFVQLVHCGGQADPALTGQPAVAPSAVDHPLYSRLPAALSRREIAAIVAEFAAAARRARDAGADGIQLHAAHGYLISQFLSPALNRRRDEYGGSPANRRRFLREIYLACRAAVGPELPITVKINGRDYLEGGLELPETIETCRQLAALGAAAVEISGGTRVSRPRQPVMTGIDRPAREAYFFAETLAVVQGVEIPVIAVGGIRSPARVAALLAAGIDLVALCRPLIREP